MVFTLHRYIFREAFKVFVLAAVALTLILSLGSVLRFVQEYGVGPQQVIHLMGYFLPITLTFVLPMAALFAAALVYGRLASDNELDACRASGISLMTLVYPGLALAIIVAISNLILSFHVMPTFVHLAQKSLKADARQILFRNIQRRGYYKLPPEGRYLIYADQADSKNDTLSGVVVTEVKGSEVKKIITAESARVHFSPHKRFNEVQITAYNTYQMNPEDKGGVFFEWLPVTVEFPSMLGDDIKFKKIDEMKKIRLDLMRFDPIAKLARDSYAQFIVELLAQDIVDKIAGGSDSFYRLHSDEKFVEFTASQCVARDEEKVQLTGDVIVVESDVATKQTLQTLHTTKALLYVTGDKLAPTLTMELYNADWQRVDGSRGLTQRHITRGLILPKAVADKVETENILEVISPASTASALRNGPSLELKGLQSGLQRRILKTLTEIKAEMHSRLVFGIGCVTLIMIGIGLGIILKGGHLLSAFGVSSVPAAVLVVCIIMGKNVTKNPQSMADIGTVLMWSGLVFLSLLAILMYRKLLKN
ncbi:MAG: LptF/LptG family permease [Planctomycetota bacterium]|nr:MAG: LptF/LptG family permease [Planctomycetota bacterium]